MYNPLYEKSQKQQLKAVVFGSLFCGFCAEKQEMSIGIADGHLFTK